MQAQRYGALPIAHATGGLADTIDDGTTNFLFATPSSDALMAACHRAFDAFDDAGQLSDMRRAAIARCFSWSGAAAEYEALYRRLIGPRTLPTRPQPPAEQCTAAAPLTDALEPAARKNPAPVICEGAKRRGTLPPPDPRPRVHPPKTNKPPTEPSWTLCNPHGRLFAPTHQKA
jgi:hypothetical protein